MASLHFIHAPMNSGKSAQLLMVANNYEEGKMKVLTVKPTLDTRDGVYIRSRALNIKRKVDISLHRGDIDRIYNKVLRKGKEDEGIYTYDVVLVDEAQFLTTSQVEEIGRIVDDFEIPVMAYGLRTDFNGLLFEGSKRLLEICDKVQEFKTVCPCCGGKAIFNMRLDKDGTPIFHGDQVQAGENYLPVCRKYYKELKEIYNG